MPEPKVLGYLLDLTHEDGKEKAEFFLAGGFTRREWRKLAETLKVHAIENEVASVRVLPEHGTLYAVEGMVTMPNGQMHYVRSIWAIDDGSLSPRLVSAYSIGG